jgi:cellulose synthase/poly-beta-1,6-N-acetylglucosamine synthase-like glycosyltransferase
MVSDQQPRTKISVIIPARNEEGNIGKLLTSLQSQTYPAHLFEVIVVDDHSTDNTAAIVKGFASVKLIQIQFDNINSYKKKAIETGIAAASGDLIVTTDADCIVKETWLKTIAAFKEETNAVFIAAPVSMQCNSTLLQIFQSMDFMVLQGITAASVKKRIHNMCNGANLAYERKIFFEVNGFKDIDHIASGDDMLLMQKISQHHPGRVSYLLSKDAIVTTEAAKTWKEFFNQRIRWASKATNYNDIKIFSALFLVYFFNCALLALLITGFWIHDLWLGFLSVLIIKTIVELIFLYPIAKFYNKQGLLTLFPFFQPLHIIYTVIAGWLGVFGSFEWKGRRVK